MKEIWSLVITGGPCSGKTTALSTIEQELSSRGYYVLVIPETATELISTGIRPFGNSLNLFDFQYVVFKKQLFKENLYKEVAEKLISSDKIVLLHDRGIMDNKSYVSSEEFNQILKSFNLTEVEARDHYDAVFHLVTAANGAEEFYTLENNKARTETLEEARHLDELGIRNWTGHAHFRVIDNSTDFDGKIFRLMQEIYSVLGEPIPLEIERKYLINKPSFEELQQYVSLTQVDIVQTYLIPNDESTERRVRQRGQNGNFFYYYTEKRKISSLKRVEIEKKITEKEYIQYLTQIDTSVSPVVKKRYCFAYKGQYFEMDFYDFSENRAILEIELTEESSEVDIPPCISVIREVTSDDAYRNHSLAELRTL